MEEICNFFINRNHPLRISRSFLDLSFFFLEENNLNSIGSKLNHRDGFFGWVRGIDRRIVKRFNQAAEGRFGKFNSPATPLKTRFYDRDQILSLCV